LGSAVRYFRLTESLRSEFQEFVVLQLLFSFPLAPFQFSLSGMLNVLILPSKSCETRRGLTDCALPTQERAPMLEASPCSDLLLPRVLPQLGRGVRVQA
jgi:hypothetical protein